MGLNMMKTYNSLIIFILFSLFPFFSHGEELIGRIEPHSMIMNGEIMKMRKITPELFKNKKYKFQPGGNHLMLFGVKRKLIAGGEINLLFTFQLKNKKKLTESIRFKIK
jgi:copper(I)-binding protein